MQLQLKFKTIDINISGSTGILCYQSSDDKVAILP